MPEHNQQDIARLSARAEELQWQVERLRSRVITGSGTPTSTPAFIGQQYIDTTNDKYYGAVSTNSTGWALLGSGGTGLNQIFNDDFSRPDSLSLGGNYNEINGSNVESNNTSNEVLFQATLSAKNISNVRIIPLDSYVAKNLRVTGIFGDGGVPGSYYPSGLLIVKYATNALNDDDGFGVFLQSHPAASTTDIIGVWDHGVKASSSFTFADATYYNFIAEIRDTNVRLRVWKVGDLEPTTWQIDYSVSSIDSAGGSVCFKFVSMINASTARGKLDTLTVYEITS